MFISALLDPLSLLVLVFIAIMTMVSFLWYRAGQQHLDAVTGGVQTLRHVGLQLTESHPIRKRLESAAVVDLSFEEIAKLMTGESIRRHALGLVHLRDKLSWIERFSQYAIHLGILGTVFALVSSDPTDLESFRAKLPLALGTTFWGLIGALMLSTIAGMAESLLERANGHVRDVLLNSLEDHSDPKSVKPIDKLILDAPPGTRSDDETIVEPTDQKPAEGV